MGRSVKITEPAPEFLKGVPVIGLGSTNPSVSRFDNLRFSTGLAHSGDWAEFGVKRGKSARFLLALLPQNNDLYLLDSFEGLPEEFVLEVMSDGTRRVKPKGRFACDVPVFDDPRVCIIKGFYKDHINALVGKTDYLSFVHIDCDLCSATADAFVMIEDLIGPGTVIQFDELWGYPNWRNGEYKALQMSGLTYEWVSRNHNDAQATLVIT